MSDLARCSLLPFLRGSAALFAVLTLSCPLIVPTAARAQDAATATATQFYTFPSYDGAAPDGYDPTGRLVRDAAGNLYATAASNVGYGNGLVFKVTPAGAISVLHQFKGADGSLPNSLFLAGDGNFYGAAFAGGPNNAGTLYQLTPAGGFTILHDFNASIDGDGPNSMLQGSDGNFYGTTQAGPGTTAAGTLYQITPAGKVTILHTFTGLGDGVSPRTLIQGSDGSLYGTTYGAYTEDEFGTPSTSIPATVFRLAPDGTFTTIYTFPINNGELGPNSLIQGSDGNLYGTTAAYLGYDGEPSRDGTVFQVTTAGDQTTLHVLTQSEGFVAIGLTQASDGYIYGTTSSTVFRFNPAGAFTLLYSTISAPAGQSSQSAVTPTTPLLENSDGSFDGGFYTGLYQLALVPHPSFFAGQVPLQNNVYYLSFAAGNFFGYYSYLPDPNYIYHQDLGYEYLIDADDGTGGLYLYDFASQGFFYTSPSFPFPYLYDFNLKSILYYFPDPDNAGRYNLYGTRYFYDFATGQIITL